ncbi:MAG: hypothetical protein ACHQT8_02295 [Chlamydiales bacterium]
MQKVEIVSTQDFILWLEALPLKEKLLIKKRLLHVEAEGHFGKVKPREGGLFELKWKNGKRVYFGKIGNKKIILLSGGGKNGQEKDIKKARVSLKRLSHHPSS